MSEYTYKSLDFSEEVMILCSINERFDNEAPQIQVFRASYGNIMQKLTLLRDEAWRGEAGRNYSIAITELENSLMRAIKWYYSKK